MNTAPPSALRSALHRARDTPIVSASARASTPRRCSRQPSLPRSSGGRSGGRRSSPVALRAYDAGRHVPRRAAACRAPAAPLQRARTRAAARERPLAPNADTRPALLHAGSCVPCAMAYAAAPTALVRLPRGRINGRADATAGRLLAPPCRATPFGRSLLRTCRRRGAGVCAVSVVRAPCCAAWRCTARCAAPLTPAFRHARKPRRMLAF